MTKEELLNLLGSGEDKTREIITALYSFVEKNSKNHYKLQDFEEELENKHDKAGWKERITSFINRIYREKEDVKKDPHIEYVKKIVQLDRIDQMSFIRTEIENYNEKQPLIFVLEDDVKHDLEKIYQRFICDNDIEKYKIKNSADFQFILEPIRFNYFDDLKWDLKKVFESNNELSSIKDLFLGNLIKTKVTDKRLCMYIEISHEANGDKNIKNSLLNFFKHELNHLLPTSQPVIFIGIPLVHSGVAIQNVSRQMNK